MTRLAKRLFGHVLRAFSVNGVVNRYVPINKAYISVNLNCSRRYVSVSRYPGLSTDIIRISSMRPEDLDYQFARPEIKSEIDYV